MAKNKTKNNKSKRNKQSNIRRELIFREAGQEYAQVTKMLGNCRVTAYCFDGISRMCQIRGSMRKKVMIQLGDIILIGLREYQNDLDNWNGSIPAFSFDVERERLERFPAVLKEFLRNLAILQGCSNL